MLGDGLLSPARKRGDLVVVIGVTVATIGAVTESDALLNAVAWFKSTVLTG